MTYVIKSMEFKEQKALVRDYDPVTKCTQVLIPEIFIASKNIHEVKVRGEFQKGQIILVSGKRDYSLSYNSYIYTGELFKAEEKDYMEMLDMVSDILENSFDQRKYDEIRGSFLRAPKKIREKLLPYLPDLRNGPVSEEYSLIAYLKC